jgi:hypothetical protein
MSAALHDNRVPVNFWSLDCLASADDEHRYWLSRRIDLLPYVPPKFEPYMRPKREMLLYLMLNPSRARGVGQGDPTQRKCDGFTRRLGYGRYGLLNLFSYSTPYPENLFDFGYEHAVGALNDLVLRLTFQKARAEKWPVICAWGSPSKLTRSERRWVDERVAEVYDLAQASELSLYALHTGDGGYPRHPLMLGYEHASFKPWTLL